MTTRTKLKRRLNSTQTSKETRLAFKLVRPSPLPYEGSILTKQELRLARQARQVA